MSKKKTFSVKDNYQTAVDKLVAYNNCTVEEAREYLDQRLQDVLASKAAAALERLYTNEKYENTDFFQGMYFLGRWDSFWVDYYQFGREIGIDYGESINKKFAAYREYQQTNGISFLYENVFFTSDYPCLLTRDHNEKTHNADGPYIAFRDGYECYSWHGLEVPKEWILEKEKITTDMIMKQTNAELRRVLIEIYAHVHGPDKIIQDMNASVISEDINHGKKRVLYRLPVDDLKFIHVINGTQEPDGSYREFFLGADPAAETPHAAVASSYGIPADRYTETVRT